MAQIQGVATAGSNGNPGEHPLGAALAINDGNRSQLMDRLQLDAGQGFYWHKFEAKLDAYSKLFYEEKPVTAYTSDSAPRQFARLTDSFQNRLAALEDIEEAAKELYALLNADQQKTANQFLLSVVPNFASTTNCVPVESKVHMDKRDTPQRSRRGAMGSLNGSSVGAGNQF